MLTGLGPMSIFIPHHPSIPSQLARAWWREPHSQAHTGSAPSKPFPTTKILKIAKFTIFTRKLLLPASRCFPSLPQSRHFQNVLPWAKRFGFGVVILEPSAVLVALHFGDRHQHPLIVGNISPQNVSQLEMLDGDDLVFLGACSILQTTLLQVAPPPRGLFAPLSSIPMSIHKDGSNLTSFLPQNDSQKAKICNSSCKSTICSNDQTTGLQLLQIHNLL